MVINRKLDEYVIDKEELVRLNPFHETRFGLSREGKYINQWQMGYERIGSYFNSPAINFSSVYKYVAIHVPTTDTGVIPLTIDEQPYGWDGKINEYTAERAVWWAFEIMDEQEARDFMKEHCPVVIFNFMETGKWRTLTVRYTGEIWIAERLD